jgi:predicted GTPase
MKDLLRVLHPLHVLAFLLLLLPLLLVFALGLHWLWQAGTRWYWLAGFAASMLAGYALQAVLARRQRGLLEAAATTANPDWPAAADEAWRRVEALADGVEPQDWPLDDATRLVALGRAALETVARAYHPQAERPLLELTVPHTLLIIERASRDLRADIAGQVPFSHRLTIGDVLRMRRWKASAERLFDVYRAGRLVVNPLEALIGEAKKHLLGRSFGLARIELHRWLLRSFVRKVGYYAIDLYSGRLPLDDATPSDTRTAASQADAAAAARAADAPREPLRIVVLGCANAGKSSLVNALFGRLAVATDVLADTTRAVTPRALVRDGLTEALIFDTPGCDTARFDRDALLATAREADLILWVSAVHRPARDTERRCLDALRAEWSARQARRPPPLLVVASHIDQLRPAAEWQPPYDLATPRGAKAATIRAAVAALAAELDVPLAHVVPVCLAEGRVYNVDDALWASVLDQQQAALKSRLLRCLEARRRSEDWALLRHQLLATGRFVRDLPERLWQAYDGHARRP